MGATTSVSNVIFSVFSFLISVLEVIVAAAAVAIPLLMAKKPADKTKKIMLLVAIAAVAVLFLSSVVSAIQTIVVFITHDLGMGNVFSLLLSCALGLIGTVLALLFPILANILKKEIPYISLVLILPAIQAIIRVINSATGFSSTYGMNCGFNFCGVFANILILAALVLAAVWYLTGRKPQLSMIVVIASAAAVVLGMILSLIGAGSIAEAIGYSTVPLTLRLNMSLNIFPVQHRMLLMLIAGMGLQSMMQAKAAAPVQRPVVYPTYPNPYNNNPPQN